MSFELKTDPDLSKEKTYELIIPQLIELVKDEKNLIANLANICSVLKYSFERFIWVGFYLINKDNKGELVLGPFQGRVACTRISLGKGVCGVAAIENKTIIVDDVNKFPGHITCDVQSKSEIVVPVTIDNTIVAVLDIDSDVTDNFDIIDKKYLEEIIQNISHLFEND